MSAIMDDWTRRHFERWLYEVVPSADRQEVRRKILALLKNDPTLLEGHSWLELRSLAEGLDNPSRRSPSGRFAFACLFDNRPGVMLVVTQRPDCQVNFCRWHFDLLQERGFEGKWIVGKLDWTKRGEGEAVARLGDVVYLIAPTVRKSASGEHRGSSLFIHYLSEDGPYLYSAFFLRFSEAQEEAEAIADPCNRSNPLTKKGSTILRAMQKTYGPKAGKRVFYASARGGRIFGVERRNPWALFNRFELRLRGEDVKALTVPGMDATDEAEAIIKLPYVHAQLEKISPEAIRKELAEYGAWSDEELADDRENRVRLVWVAAGNVKEDIYQRLRERKARRNPGGFVIVRSDGKFVAPSGSVSSYTKDITKARRFSSREEAERDLCPGNERVVALDRFFGNPLTRKEAGQALGMAKRNLRGAMIAETAGRRNFIRGRAHGMAALVERFGPRGRVRPVVGSYAVSQRAIKALENPGHLDMTAARELLLFIENDRDLYRQSQSIEQNLARKVGRGVYDKRLAVKLWGYLVEAGAKKYAREYGGTEPWHRQFSTDTRLATAAMLSRSFQDKWEAGKWGGQDIAEGTRRLGKGRYINPLGIKSARRAWKGKGGLQGALRKYRSKRPGAQFSRLSEVLKERPNPGPVIGEQCLAIETSSGPVVGSFGACIGLPDGTSLVKGVFTRVPEGYVRSISYAAPAKTRAEEPYFREAGIVKPGERVDYDRPWRHNMEGMHVRACRVPGGLLLRSDKGLPVWKRLPHKTVVEGQPA